MTSERARSIDSSGIRRVFDLAQSLKDPINLSIGQPDFDAWPEMKNAAIKAISQGRNSYTVTQGIEELRVAVRKKYSIPEAEKDVDVFITSGVSGGLLLSYFALLDPGDEILTPDPFFCMYRDLAMLVNAVPQYYDSYPDFSLSAERIEAQISERTKAILVNSPANPTGYAVSQQELDQVIELCRQKNIWLIYDEIYQAFCYDQAHAQCFGNWEKTIILNGLSKSHGITGWRIGYCIGPSEIIQEMLKIQQYSFVCAPSIAQWGAAAGFEHDLNAVVQEYKKKRDFLVANLSPDYKFIKPGGAFYMFPEAPKQPAQTFVEDCIKNNLLVVPGNVFSTKDTHFRISFSAPQKTLERGAEVLNSLV